MQKNNPMIAGIDWAKAKRAAALRRAAPELLLHLKNFVRWYEDSRAAIPLYKIVEEAKKIISRIDRWGGDKS